MRAMAAMPLPPQRHRSPWMRTSISSQWTPWSVRARSSTGSTSSMPRRVASEKTTPNPNVSVGRFRSKTTTSEDGSASFSSVAAKSPPGPPPTMAVRTRANITYLHTTDAIVLILP